MSSSFSIALNITTNITAYQEKSTSEYEMNHSESLLPFLVFFYIKSSKLNLKHGFFFYKKRIFLNCFQEKKRVKRLQIYRKTDKQMDRGRPDKKKSEKLT